MTTNNQYGGMMLLYSLTEDISGISFHHLNNKVMHLNKTELLIYRNDTRRKTIKYTHYNLVYWNWGMIKG